MPQCGTPGMLGIRSDGVVLQDQPIRDTLVKYMRDGVGVHGFPVDAHRKPAVSYPYHAP